MRPSGGCGSVRDIRSRPITAGLSIAIAAALHRDGRRIVVTGAGGWIGMAALDLLNGALGADFARRVHCFGSSARMLRLIDGVEIAQRPLEEIAALDSRPTIVLHFAFLTKERAETMDDAAYRAANRAIGARVRDALDAIGAEAVFVASSGAARFAENADASPAMRLYGALKKEDEEAFAAWAAARGRTMVIARIFNIAGPYINKHHAYALAGFILDAQAGREIRVRAPHPVVRGYVAIRELMSLVFALLLEGGGVTFFDSGGEALELEAVARIVAGVVGPVAVSRAPLTSERADAYCGDDARYRALLARHGIAAVPVDRQIAETAAFLAAVA